MERNILGWLRRYVQVRHFSRSHRCITFAARGYLPSDVPTDNASYSQDLARTDVIAVMDHFGLEKAHVVGHSMGAYTALHVGLHHPERCLSVSTLACGWGSNPAEREASAKSLKDIAKMFEEKLIEEAASIYACAPMRLTFKAKDPRGFAEFEKMLAEHSALGLVLTILNLQMLRPTLWDLQEHLKSFVPPLLVIVGDEDFPSLDGSLFLKRIVPTAGLYVVPRAGHTIPLEEPGLVNQALFDFFANAEAGTWMGHHRN